MFLDKYFFLDEKFQFTCDEYAKVLVPTWYDKAIELMFADALNIGWSGEDYLHSDYIDETVWEIDRNLEKYHNISVNWSYTDDYKGRLIETICAEIEKGNPVGLII